MNWPAGHIARQVNTPLNGCELGDLGTRPMAIHAFDDPGQSGALDIGHNGHPLD